MEKQALNQPYPLGSQLALFEGSSPKPVAAFNRQLLKWVGNKQRFAPEIISNFPKAFGTYFEPFLGSGAVLGTLAPESAIATDCYGPLVEIWQSLRESPELLKLWYATRWEKMMAGEKVEEYGKVLASYNARPNGPDLLFLCRSAYGGVVRFRKDGYMSTPCGIHKPISPESFSKRVDEWHKRTSGTQFMHMEYDEAMAMAKEGDLIYCDPPYSYSQAILYGAQDFSLSRLFEVIGECKKRGVYVALSIDGSKKSGEMLCDIPLAAGVFEREVIVDVGRSMLKRFQMGGQTLEQHIVADRLLLTY